MSDAAPAAPQPTKQRRKWPWVVAAIFGVLCLIGTLFPGPPYVGEMSCLDLRSEMVHIRADNTLANGNLRPFVEWDDDDLDRMHDLIDEIRRRQQANDGNYCAMG